MRLRIRKKIRRVTGRVYNSRIPTVLLANLMHFGLSSVQQIVHILSQHVSRCWLLLTSRLVPFLNLLVPFLSNVYTIFGSRIHINTSFEIVSLDNRHVSTYTLLAVVYYADQHFTAQLSPVMGELGYDYDGLALINPNVQPILEEVGSIHRQPDLQSCQGGQATAIIYTRLS